ncbi:hypothetical protein DRJ04_04025 [Candidatus Aerophobetes bacterium]|uniref:Uncharacterized protein n=1 Tax=Aerophobetes bacterium TaxID=2030807 RepID=A0A662DGF4_UNCAE|nr:MAG: hypothetical protein DRJ04_04025 [Candidatus Aerophobetes bacterium]
MVFTRYSFSSLFSQVIEDNFIPRKLITAITRATILITKAAITIFSHPLASDNMFLTWHIRVFLQEHSFSTRRRYGDSKGFLWSGLVDNFR